jgi:hypothetical protein
MSLSAPRGALRARCARDVMEGRGRGQRSWGLGCVCVVEVAEWFVHL